MAAKRTAAKSEPEAPKQDEKPVDGVFVVKGKDDNGSLRTQIVLNGDLQVTEVQTLLEVAIRDFRAEIGLS